MEWGVGIEHEVLMLNHKTEDILGKTIKDRLNCNNCDNYKLHVNRLIETDKTYKIARSDYMPTYEITETIESKIDEVVIGNTPSNKLLIKIQELINIYKKKFIKKESLTNFEALEIICGSDSLYDNERTNHFNMQEYTTPGNSDGSLPYFYKNKLISEYCEELSLKQNIIVNCVSFIRKGEEKDPNKAKDINKRYMTTGSIFPIYDEDGRVAFDYTGSYHLNLSLPYDKDMLSKEEDICNVELEKFKQSANRSISILSTMTYTQQYNWLLDVKNITSLYDFILETEYGKTRKDINNTIDNTVFKYMSRAFNKYDNPFYRSIFNDIPIIDLSDKNIYFKMTNNPSTIVGYKRREDPRESYLEYLDLFYTIGNYQIETDHELKDIVSTLKNDIFDKLSLKQDESIWFSFCSSHYIHYNILNDRQGLTPWQFIGLGSDTMDISMIYDKISRTFNRYIDTSVIGKNIFTDLKTYYGYSLNKVYSDYYNWLKYTYSDFHKLHKNWAIGIQWIMPLILSCYSSCDPLSIGDNDKLTELSYRIYISYFAPFINLDDVMNDNIPIERTYEGKEKRNTKIIQLSKDTFDYENNMYDGNEFRSEGHGFKFGFELRIFDNFDIELMGMLLEMLILLADHIAYINKHYTFNPYDNDILNTQIIAILKQGWNTKIESNYIDLLNQQLDIKLDNSKGQDAYTIMNNIYRLLQKTYITKNKSKILGKGIGPYGRHMINRGHGIKNFPNVNRESWNYNFNKLIWNPNTRIKQRITEAISKSNTRDELVVNLQNYLGETYDTDIDDIICFLLDKKIINARFA